MNKDLLLSDEERHGVFIPCEDVCGQHMPDFTSAVCLDCVAHKFCQAQLTKAEPIIRAEERKAIGEYLDKTIMQTDNRVTKLWVLGDIVKALKDGQALKEGKE